MVLFAAFINHERTLPVQQSKRGRALEAILALCQLPIDSLELRGRLIKQIEELGASLASDLGQFFLDGVQLRHGLF